MSQRAVSLYLYFWDLALTGIYLGTSYNLQGFIDHIGNGRFNAQTKTLTSEVNVAQISWDIFCDKEALLGFEPRISCLRDRRFTTKPQRLYHLCTNTWSASCGSPSLVSHLLSPEWNVSVCTNYRWTANTSLILATVRLSRTKLLNWLTVWCAIIWQ